MIELNGPQITGGYILVSRKLIESEIWEKPPLYLKVWMYLLMRAQYKPFKDLERGELVVSIPELIEACSYKVGYRTEKPTKSQIFNILEWLRNSNEGSDERYSNETMIETTKTTRGMVVKVTNYNVYQDSKNYEQNDERNSETSTNDTMPKRQADTINKNVKKELRTKELNTTTSTMANMMIDKEVKEVQDTFENNVCLLSPMQNESLEAWFNDFNRDKEIMNEAIRITADRDRKNFGMFQKLLKEWSQNKLTNIDQVKTYERNKYNKGQAAYPRRNGFQKEEMVPDWFKKEQQPVEESTDPEIERMRQELLEEFERERMKAQ